MTDEQERDEWFKLRDATVARLMAADPTLTREQAFEAMALTFWRIIADRIEPFDKK